MSRPYLRRLDQVWIQNPVYFLTTTVAGRRKLLDCDASYQVLAEEWRSAKSRHGWTIGRYVVMPDHTHFFASPTLGAKPLADMMNKLKEWSAKRILPLIGRGPPLWQSRFFDHVIRDSMSFSEKWEYMRDNPVVAGLVGHPDDWPYQGYIDFDGLQ